MITSREVGITFFGTTGADGAGGAGGDGGGVSGLGAGPAVVPCGGGDASPQFTSTVRFAPKTSAGLVLAGPAAGCAAGVPGATGGVLAGFALKLAVISLI